jgi:hypothetical protein
MIRFAIAAAVEAATGIALLISPALAGELLLGRAPDPAGAALCRFGGIALLFLAVACWPEQGSRAISPAARRAIWLFQPAAAACLLWVAFGFGLRGPVLWPAVAYHLAAAVALGRGARRWQSP